MMDETKNIDLETMKQLNRRISLSARRKSISDILNLLNQPCNLQNTPAIAGESTASLFHSATIDNILSGDQSGHAAATTMGIVFNDPISNYNATPVNDLVLSGRVNNIETGSTLDLFNNENNKINPMHQPQKEMLPEGLGGGLLGDDDLLHVNKLQPYDVVCGRNSSAFNHIGNRRFRLSMMMNLQRYMDAPTREDKTQVIKSLVVFLQEDVGCRFLKKVDRTTYIFMTEKQIREKIGHSLRDLVSSNRRKNEQRR